MGIKTEFLGRVGLTFNIPKVSLESMLGVMRDCRQLELYLKLYPEVTREHVEDFLEKQITDAYEKNTLGFRLINTLVNQYFIKGEKAAEKSHKSVTFQKTLKFNNTL